MLKRLFCLRSSSHPPLFQFEQYSKARYSNKTCRWRIKLAKDCSPPCILRESFKDVTLIFFFITEIFLLHSIIIIIRFYLSEQHIIILYILFQSCYYAISTFSPLLRRDFNSEKNHFLCTKTKQETHKCNNYAGVKAKLNFIPDSLLCLLLYIHSGQLMTQISFAVNLEY